MVHNRIRVDGKLKEERKECLGCAAGSSLCLPFTPQLGHYYRLDKREEGDDNGGAKEKTEATTPHFDNNLLYKLDSVRQVLKARQHPAMTDSGASLQSSITTCSSP
jgi:hypothetical protein